jgi:hypothetical protein
MKLKKIAKLQHHIYKGLNSIPQNKKTPTQRPLIHIFISIIVIRVIEVICLYETITYYHNQYK